MQYLLDTNICIYIIKRKPLNVFNKFQSLSVGSVGISAITLAELEYGIAKSMNPESNRTALEKFLIPLNVIDFGADSTNEYGKIRAALEKQGTPIGSFDLLIAAHAKSLDLILVTNNEKEFERIEHLKIENWVKNL